MVCTGLVLVVDGAEMEMEMEVEIEIEIRVVVVGSCN